MGVFKRPPVRVSASLAWLVASSVPALAGDPGAVLSQQKISDTSGGLSAPLMNADVFGRSVCALGDLDGDGIGDVAVGANGDSEAGPRRGAVYVLLLNADGSVKAEQKINDVHGGFNGPLSDFDRFGRAVTALGDLDDDGTPDLAVGAHLDDDGGPSGFRERGAVWILFLNPDGTVKADQKISAISGDFNGAIDLGDQFGISVAGLGDLDGDGIEDLAVGANFDDDGGGGMNVDTGAVWVLFLRTDGTVRAHQKISNTQGGFTGAADAGNNRGVGLGAESLGLVGDLDGDGSPELACGSIGDAAVADTVWILFLEPDGTTSGYSRITGSTGGFGGALDPDDEFGSAVAGVGDLDGDGVLDLAVGAFDDDDGGADRGAVWLLFLEPDGSVASERKISQTQGGFGGVLSDADRFGVSLAGLGDHDGDGALDLMVGAHLDDDGGDRRGAAWVLFLDGENQPPLFDGTPCGETLVLAPGEDLSLLVSASDLDLGDVVSLAAVDMPASAGLFPPDRVAANPVSTVFTWTPTNGDVGSHVVRFRATDSGGAAVVCEFSIDVLPGACGGDEPNRREPGSLLLYPEYQNGPGRITLMTVTNTNCNVLDGSVRIEFRYIDGEDCSKADQSLDLTPCDTFSWLTSTHTGQGHGYLYLYAKNLQNTDANSNGEPIVFNHLVGQQLVVDGFQALEYSINAVSFAGIGEQGEGTDRDADGIRDLDGEEYAPAPAEILIPRFLGNDSGDRAEYRSELILVALSGGKAFTSSSVQPGGGTTVDFLIYNDNEEVFSSEYTFSCWDKVPLEDISNIFRNDELQTFTNDDPNEIAGSDRESGWIRLDGAVANSVSDSIHDPAIYAVLVEYVGNRAAADLPFEHCVQYNGDLLPTSIFGDGPDLAVGDDE